MSQNFVKLFTSITESTIWCEPDRTRLLWITLLSMSDPQGNVWASVPGLANRARIPVEDCRIGLDTLLSPDRESRSDAHEGRRIEPIPGGWRIFNYLHYRNLKNEEAQKASKREYMRRWRRAQRAAAQINISAQNVKVVENPAKKPK